LARWRVRRQRHCARRSRQRLSARPVASLIDARRILAVRRFRPLPRFPFVFRVQAPSGGLLRSRYQQR
jgi:hypothetical protein